LSILKAGGYDTGLGGLVEGQRLHFDIETDGHGRKVASNLRLI
jgi:cold shock CspA family protein